MPWVKLDDQFSDHPKVLEVGPLAECLFVRGLTYASRYLTDGFVPVSHLRRMGDLDALTEADKLVSAGLWDEAENGYQIHDYLEYQPSAEQVKADRTMAKRRKELYADPGLVHRVRGRDENRCRYCGVEVRWNDRKGARGGTYDHVIPDGPNTDENIVVACRGCNSSKGQRTPEQAGMPLLTPGTSMSSLKPRSSWNGSSSDLDQTNQESANPYPTRPEPVPQTGEDSPQPPQAAGNSPAAEEPRPRSEKQRANDARHERRLALYAAWCVGVGLDPDGSEASIGRDIAFRHLKPLIDQPDPTPDDFGACTIYLASQSWRDDPPSIPQVIQGFGRWVGQGRPKRASPRAPTDAQPRRRNGGMTPEELAQRAVELRAQGR